MAEGRLIYLESLTIISIWREGKLEHKKLFAPRALQRCGPFETCYDTSRLSIVWRSSRQWACFFTLHLSSVEEASKWNQMNTAYTKPFNTIVEGNVTIWWR